MALGCNTAALRIRRKMSVSTPPVCLLRWPVCWSTPGTVQREHGFTNGSRSRKEVWLDVPSTSAFISSSSKALQPSMWRFVLKRSIPICGPPSWATLVQSPQKVLESRHESIMHQSVHGSEPSFLIALPGIGSGHWYHVTPGSLHNSYCYKPRLDLFS